MLPLVQDGKKLPRQIIAQLAEMYGTSSANLRQIKHRTLKQVKTFLNQRYNLDLK